MVSESSPENLKRLAHQIVWGNAPDGTFTAPPSRATIEQKILRLLESLAASSPDMRGQERR